MYIFSITNKFIYNVLILRNQKTINNIQYIINSDFNGYKNTSDDRLRKTKS